MQNKNVYALLLSVGNYEKMEISNLPTFMMDIALLENALVNGLKVPNENVRKVLGFNNDGFVTTTSLAHAISDFKSKLGNEDIFIFYFSGHGRSKNFIFSNGQIDSQSLIRFVSELNAGTKLVIMDCCYSGDFIGLGPRKMQFDEMMSDFAGKGMAVFASSSANEVSRLGPQSNHSMFTGALSTAILAVAKSPNGKISLNDIYDKTMFFVRAWNVHNPSKEQRPIFRSSIGGSIYFNVEKISVYKPLEVTFELSDYSVFKVTPLSNSIEKRLAAFVIYKEELSDELISVITKDIVEQIKDLDVFQNEETERKFKGKTSDVIWCYYGTCEEDIYNNNFFAYTIWAQDEGLRKKYYKQNPNSRVITDIYLFKNVSYELVKKIQNTDKSTDTIVREYKVLLTLLVSFAEEYIYDLQEVKNSVIGYEELTKKYNGQINKIKKIYLKLSDEDIPPLEAKEWCDEIYSLAGWILDLSMSFENVNDLSQIKAKEWILDNCIRHYRECVEKIKNIEEELD